MKGDQQAEPNALGTALRVLVVDDDERIRQVCKQCLLRDGHQVTTVSTAEDALRAVEKEFFQVVFLDIRLKSNSGLDIIQPLLERNSTLKIIVITAHASISSAVDAMQRGATDYLPKPFSVEQVRLALKKAVDLRKLENQVELLEQDRSRTEAEGLMPSSNPRMQGVIEEAQTVAQSEATILLRGESGTGKGVLARAIHQWSDRAGKPFAVVHAPSLSRDLVESELFGHVKGAFTGATTSSPGRISQAEGGTLFLDEIADLPVKLQPKLLRFVQSKEYERVGDPATLKSDVRLLAATNQDLEALVQEGAFREDLFYRLNVIELKIPPLRERPEDIADLAHQFLAYFAQKYSKEGLRFGSGALDRMKAYVWPGNVRELRNIVERAVIISKGGEVESNLLPIRLDELDHSPSLGGSFSLSAIENEHIRRVLSTASTMEEAAQTLEIDPSTLWRKRKNLEIKG